MISINPFKKKQPAEEAAREQYLPAELETFRAQPQEPPQFEAPEHERKFRAFAREMENPQDIGFSFGERIENAPAERGVPQIKPSDNSDRLDMILQKLETIDLRLKLIEQKMERRVM